MSQSNLSSLPPEILDYASSFIASPRDLLSFALTAKSIHALIIPHHLEFRIVRCELSRAQLWDALADRKEFAARLNTLEILDVPEVLPAIAPKLIPGTDTDLAKLNLCSSNCDCTRRLQSAISKMHGLRRFGWVGPEKRSHNAEPVFEALGIACVNLQELELEYFDSTPSFDSVSVPVGFFL
jgi:hypothetical protein